MEKKRIGFELKKITTRMKRILDLQCADSREPITGVQGWIVAYVCNNPDRDVFQRDIEEMFRIRRSTATGILNGMQAAGLISRRAVDYDALPVRVHDCGLAEKFSLLCCELSAVAIRVGQSEFFAFLRFRVDIFRVLRYTTCRSSFYPPSRFGRKARGLHIGRRRSRLLLFCYPSTL